MQKFLTVSLLIGFSNTAASYETKWMERVVDKHPCLESLGPVIEEESKCLSWTRFETADPFVDTATSRLYIGGSDSYMHVLEAKGRKGRMVKRAKLDGNLMAAPASVESDLVFGTTNAIAYRSKKSDLSVVWKKELDSGILRTPVIDGDNALFVTQLGTLYALNVKTGEESWSKKRELPNRIFLARMSMPVVLETKVNGALTRVIALGNPNGKLDFFDAKTGAAIADSIQVGVAKDPFGDVATTPVVTDTTIYVASYNSSLVAIDRLSRVTKGEIKEPGITEIAFSQGVLVAAGSKFVIGIDAQTRKERWRYKFERGAPTSIQINGTEVIVGSDRDGLYVLDLFNGEPNKQVLGSGLGFASPVKNLGDDVLAMSTAGALFYFNRTDSLKR